MTMLRPQHPWPTHGRSNTTALQNFTPAWPHSHCFFCSCGDCTRSPKACQHSSLLTPTQLVQRPCLDCCCHVFFFAYCYFSPFSSSPPQSLTSHVMLVPCLIRRSCKFSIFQPASQNGPATWLLSRTPQSHVSLLLAETRAPLLEAIFTS